MNMAISVGFPKFPPRSSRLHTRKTSEEKQWSCVLSNTVLSLRHNRKPHFLLLTENPYSRQPYDHHSFIANAYLSDAGPMRLGPKNSLLHFALFSLTTQRACATISIASRFTQAGESTRLHRGSRTFLQNVLQQPPSLHCPYNT